MKELRLNSKLINTCDYHDIDLSEFAIPLQADQARYERDMKNFCKIFATKEEVTEIAPQDMATLSLSSENPKFQKEHITVRVGLGLYSRELEGQLVGMIAGEVKTVTVGKDAVTVTVEKIIREIIPELTDELAARSGIPEVRTAEDARAYCRFKQYDDLLEMPADDACAHLAREQMKRSSFDLDEGELAVAEKIIREMIHFDPADDSEEKEAVVEEFFSEENICVMIENTLACAVLGQNIKALTDEDYETYIGKLVRAVQRPEEDVRKEHPVTEYLINTYNDQYNNDIERYVFWRLKELGEARADETV